MSTIGFVIYDEPTPKARPRVTKHGTYTPEKTKAAEDSFRLQAAKWKPAQPFKGPVSLEVTFFRSMPRSFSRAKKHEARRGWVRPVSKPDLDNLTKLVKDAMNGQFYVDDSQVVRTVAEKYYSDVPRIYVKLQEIGLTE